MSKLTSIFLVTLLLPVISPLACNIGYGSRTYLDKGHFAGCESHFSELMSVTFYIGTHNQTEVAALFVENHHRSAKQICKFQEVAFGIEMVCTCFTSGCNRNITKDDLGKKEFYIISN